MRLLELLDRPIAFQRCFVTLTGSINAALMLSQAVYWSNRTEDADGWFYKSRDEWTDETGLTHEQQESARKRLLGAGVWEERDDRLNHRVFFRVLEDVLREQLRKIPVSPNRKTRRREAVQNGAAGTLFPVPSNRAKTTAETTAEKGAQAPEAAAFMTAWNSLPQPFSKIRVMSSGRARALGARLKETGWRENWRTALDKLPGSSFLSGKVAPRMDAQGQTQKPWVADVDFFLRPDSVAKILEGKYDDAPESGAPANRPDFWKAHL